MGDERGEGDVVGKEKEATFWVTCSVPFATGPNQGRCSKQVRTLPLCGAVPPSTPSFSQAAPFLPTGVGGTCYSAQTPLADTGLSGEWLLVPSLGQPPANDSPRHHQFSAPPVLRWPVRGRQQLAARCQGQWL